MLRYASAALFVLLLAAWLTVAVRTVRDGARGRLFLPMRACFLTRWNQRSVR